MTFTISAQPFWEATVEEAVIMIGRLTLIELSDLENPERETMERKRVTLALKMAADLLYAYEVKAPDAGKLAIRVSFKRFQIDVARYYLDSEKNKSFSQERYLETLDQLKHFCEMNPLTPADATQLKLYGLQPVRTGEALICSDPRVPVFTRTGTKDFRDGKLFRSSQGRQFENPDIPN